MEPTVLSVAPLAGLGLGLAVALTTYVATHSYREMSRRPERRPYLSGWLAFMLRPLEWAAMRLGVTANQVTAVAGVLGLGAGAAFGLGWIALGGWLVGASAVLDFVDGRLARARAQESKAGAYLDSVLDRYVETAAFAGLALHYRDDPWAEGVIWLGLCGSSLVSYARARGEGLGYSCRVGFSQRFERVLILGAGSMLSPLWVLAVERGGLPLRPDGLLWAALVALAVLTNVTALRRHVDILRHVR